MSKGINFPLPCEESDYYDTSEYSFPDFEGVYQGELTYSKWRRRGGKLAFIDLKDGRKIICLAWNSNNDYFGIPGMAYGTKIEVTLKRNSKRNVVLRNLVDIEVYTYESTSDR